MLNIVVFAEDESDATIVCGLADRVFSEAGKLPSNGLSSFRSWQGESALQTFIAKSDITVKHKQLAQDSRRPRYRKSTNDKPQGSYTAFWRKAVELVVSLKKEQPLLHGVFVHCDADNHPEQEQDIRQAFASLRNVMKFVPATPDREIEAWLLNGFIPDDAKESVRLEEWKRKLSFDPCTQAERARDTSGDRDPKNILNALTNSDKDRQRQCWEVTKLEKLRQHGDKTKLNQFLDEVKCNFL